MIRVPAPCPAGQTTMLKKTEFIDLLPPSHQQKKGKSSEQDEVVQNGPKRGQNGPKRGQNRQKWATSRTKPSKRSPIHRSLFRASQECKHSFFSQFTCCDTLPLEHAAYKLDVDDRQKTLRNPDLSQNAASKVELYTISGGSKSAISYRKCGPPIFLELLSCFDKHSSLALRASTRKKFASF